MNKKKRADWESFFWNLQTKGRYTFTYQEIKDNLKLSDNSITQGLYRYKEKQQIAQVRKGFFAIIPPEYSSSGMLPAYLFIDDLMKSLNKEYYVGTISAASLYGAAHQQPMEFFVITQTPSPRNIQNDKLKISFFSKKEWNNRDIVVKKTKAGYMNVSSPELTTIDLIEFQSKFGLNRIVTILAELIQEIKVNAFVKVLKNCNNTSVLQRLGYLLEYTLNEERLSDLIYQILLKKESLPNVALSFHNEKKGTVNKKWKIIENIKIESDL